MALGLISSAAVVVQALTLADLLSGAVTGSPTNDRAAFAWLAGAAGVRALAALGSETLATRGAERVKAELRAELLAGAGATPGGPGAGELATLAGRGLDALDAYVARCLPDLVLATAVPVGLVAVIGGLDWLSGLVVLVAVSLFPVFGALVGRTGGELAASRWHQVEDLGRQIADTFEGLPVLRAFGRSGAQRRRIAEVEATLRRASLSTLRVAFLSALVLDTLASVSVAILAVPLGLRLLDGSLGLSAALAVLIVAPEVFLPLRRASADFHESTEGLAAAGRALDVIGAAGPDSSSAAGGSGAPGAAARPELLSAPDPATETVWFDGVRVAVQDRGAPLLDAPEFALAPGETVALVGANGTGKSTVISLLAGLRRPEHGQVRVGPLELARVDPVSWRRWLAYLPERPALLSDTLAANLRLARADAGDDELAAALVAAGAQSLLDRWPDGLATVLGVGGRLPSAGERQRIALARTLLRPASLYLLDEPTAHLDAQAELAAVTALGRVLAGSSTLVVTHRPAVLALADRVLRLDGGHLVPLARSEMFEAEGAAV